MGKQEHPCHGHMVWVSVKESFLVEDMGKMQKGVGFCLDEKKIALYFNIFVLCHTAKNVMLCF